MSHGRSRRHRGGVMAEPWTEQDERMAWNRLNIPADDMSQRENLIAHSLHKALKGLDALRRDKADAETQYKNSQRTVAEVTKAFEDREQRVADLQAKMAYVRHKDSCKWIPQRSGPPEYYV